MVLTSGALVPTLHLLHSDLNYIKGNVFLCPSQVMGGSWWVARYGRLRGTVLHTYFFHRKIAASVSRSAAIMSYGKSSEVLKIAAIHVGLRKFDGNEVSLAAF